MEVVDALIIGVAVNVISHYICKRLDAREEKEKIGNQPEV